jgi:hypothetical protein
LVLHAPGQKIGFPALSCARRKATFHDHPAGRKGDSALDGNSASAESLDDPDAALR